VLARGATVCAGALQCASMVRETVAPSATVSIILDAHATIAAPVCDGLRRLCKATVALLSWVKICYLDVCRRRGLLFFS
jgi:hypothetical protein